MFIAPLINYLADILSDFAGTDVSVLLSRNNAGVMFCPYQLSEDGIEMQFATNYLGVVHCTPFISVELGTILCINTCIYHLMRH